MTAAHRSRFLQMLAGQSGPDATVNPKVLSVSPAFLDQLETWRLTGWVYKRSHDIRGLLPPETAERAQARYAHNVKANLLRITELSRIEGEFRSRDIRALIVKGIALISEIYADPGVRPMSDIDMIVRPEREDNAVELLQTLGYTQDAFHPTVFRNKACIIDLKSEPFGINRIHARGDAFSSVVPQLWLRCKPLRANGWYETWNPSARLYTLCIHGLKHGFPDGIWLTDIGETLKKMTAVNWEDAVWLFRRSSSLNVLVIALLRVQDFGYALPAQPENWLHRQPLSGWGKITRDISRNAATSFIAESAYLIAGQKGITAKIRYLGQAVFPNTAIYEESPIPDGLGFLKPVHRIMRILNQTAKAVTRRS